MKLLDNLLKDKVVGIWGMGYLAYTYMLQLQANHFKIYLTDLYEEPLKSYRKGKYPKPEQRYLWSEAGNLPPLDFDGIELKDLQDDIFSEEVHIHIICIPSRYLAGAYNTNLLHLAEIFKRNVSENLKPLIIFQSVSGPGSIQRDFEEKLGTAKDRYLIGCAFRSDWSLEEFAPFKQKQVISASSKEALDLIDEFHKMMGVPTVAAASIKEAEFFENASNALEFMVRTFFNELSQAYPDINVTELTPLITKKLNLDKCGPGLGTGGFRMPSAVDHILRETSYSDHLALLNAGSDVNLSSMLSYADYLKRKGYKSILLLGVRSVQELMLSPSLIIAESLQRVGVDVGVHAPSHPPSKLLSMISGAVYFDFSEGDFSKYDAIILVSDFPEYRLVSQDFISRKVSGNISLIIDSCGVWSRFSFGDKTLYHRIGDGTLNLMD